MIICRNARSVDGRLRLGNISVDVTDPDRPRYVAVDFGIVGSLSTRDQMYLAENFLAFFKRDYRRVAKLHVDSAWVPEDTRVDELEADVRAVCEPVFNKPLKDISFGVVLLRLLETARRFEMEVQPQHVLLQKTLLAVEPFDCELYPELDLWNTVMPILKDWVRERQDPRTQAKLIVENLPQIAEDLRLVPELPQIAGVLWTGLKASPVWLGWTGVGAGLLLLFVPRRRRFVGTRIRRGKIDR